LHAGNLPVRPPCALPLLLILCYIPTSMLDCWDGAVLAASPFRVRRRFKTPSAFALAPPRCARRANRAAAAGQALARDDAVSAFALAKTTVLSTPFAAAVAATLPALYYCCYAFHPPWLSSTLCGRGTALIFCVCHQHITTLLRHVFACVARGCGSMEAASVHAEGEDGASHVLLLLSVLLHGCCLILVLFCPLFSCAFVPILSPSLTRASLPASGSVHLLFSSMPSSKPRSCISPWALPTYSVTASARRASRYLQAGRAGKRLAAGGRCVCVPRRRLCGRATLTGENMERFAYRSAALRIASHQTPLVPFRTKRREIAFAANRQARRRRRTDLRRGLAACHRAAQNTARCAPHSPQQTHQLSAGHGAGVPILLPLLSFCYVPIRYMPLHEEARSHILLKLPRGRGWALRGIIALLAAQDLLHFPQPCYMA